MPISRSSLTECWVGLVFSSPAVADVGNQGQMDVENIFVAAVGAKLADRFQKRQGLDIADRAADLDDGDVDPLGVLQDLALDLVGDMRNDLHRAAEIIAAPLLADDRCRRSGRW